MATSTQENIKDTSRFRRAFLPTPFEAVTLVVGSFIFLLAINSISFFRSIGEQNYSQVSDFISTYVEKLLAPTNNQQASRILTVFFWMFIGIMAYLAVWVISGLIRAYNSDVHSSRHWIMPQGSSRSKIFNEFILRLVVRLLATIMFFYWIYLLLVGILPYASYTFLESITHMTINGTVLLVWSVLALAGSVFVAMIFARCIVLRERVFGS
jgi:hypothetical protein